MLGNRGNTRAFLMLAALSLMVALPFGSARAEGVDPPLPDEPNRPIPLRPEPGTDVVLDEVRAMISADGTIRIDAKGHYELGAPMMAYDFHVNLDQGTYKTTLVDESDVETHTTARRLRKQPRGFDRCSDSARSPFSHLPWNILG